MPTRFLSNSFLLAGLTAALIIGADEPAYVGSKTCLECHEKEYKAWLGSDHQNAMHRATPEFVRGDFNGTTLEHFGVTSTMMRDDAGRYLIKTDNADGELTPFEVASTFGWQPLQQYLIRFPDGRVQVSPVSWDTEKKEWFHQYPDEAIPAGDPLHWTGPLFTWNRMCAECHTVDLRKNYDLDTKTYNTQYAELGVGCESCHGAGGAHVQLKTKAGVLNPLMDSTPSQMMNTCAPCHSRRSPITELWKPGEPFLDHYAPELLLDPLYFPDGQIRDEVFVYGSFMQSRMAQEGVTCNDCHEPHTLELRRPGNATCTSCHEPQTFDTPAHHHHTTGLAGSNCVDCHMPARDYMIVDPRRDHRFGSPRPDLTASLGVPNACATCHADQSNDWSLKNWKNWYGKPQTFSFAETFNLAQTFAPEAESDLVALLDEPTVAPMVRATAAASLFRYRSESSIKARLNALHDTDAVVRANAAQSLTPFTDRAEVQAGLRNLLDDPVRLVRVQAVRPLAPVDRRTWGDEEVERFNRALAEAFQAEDANADHPASHLNRGALLSALGRFDGAEDAYRTSLRLDPAFTPAEYNLALLLYDLGRPDESEKHFRVILKNEPDHAEAHYSLGLLLAEDSTRKPEALQSITRAATLAPERHDIHYNLGLLHLKLGGIEDAKASLSTAERLAPDQPEYAYALLSLMIQTRDWTSARHWAQRLQELDPENTEWEAIEKAIIERGG